MLTELFTSKTRVKLLLKLFLNPSVSCYLRELAKEFAVAPSAIKEELDSLTSAGYLEREQQGRSVYYAANTRHPFFPEIHSIVRKTLGIDRIVDQILTKVGQFEAVYLLDDYAEGRDSGIIDVLVVGDVDRVRLEQLCAVAETKINRKIRTMVVGPREFEASKDVYMRRPHWKVV
ncbi:winged helix-turn-helix domain-containing protein [Desulfocurvus vexinensis]|uniref:winged helix-turn-helix domain-containing protein n=1 Tax=Desulfocurvus vexinensis TaxID=399548 RepID=UPI000490CE9A|nr:winged helix-turn-helix domain-containing protein [Desulfocurvus vexinensis]